MTVSEVVIGVVDSTVTVTVVAGGRIVVYVTTGTV